MSFPSPTGDPDCDRKLWWRCVFIAAAVQPVLLLLSLIFQSTFFLKILMIPYLLFTGLFVNGLWHSVEHGDTQSVFMGRVLCLPCCLSTSCLPASFSARPFISCIG